MVSTNVYSARNMPASARYLVITSRVDPRPGSPPSYIISEKPPPIRRRIHIPSEAAKSLGHFGPWFFWTMGRWGDLMGVHAGYVHKHDRLAGGLREVLASRFGRILHRSATPRKEL